MQSAASSPPVTRHPSPVTHRPSPTPDPQYLTLWIRVMPDEVPWGVRLRRLLQLAQRLLRGCA